MCECNVGPGRLQDEWPITAIVHEWLDGNQDGDTLSYPDGSWAVLNVDGLDTPWTVADKAYLTEQGYCDACIEDGENDLRAAKAVSYGADSQGFLWSTLWNDVGKAQDAFEHDLAEFSDDESDLD